MVMFKLKHFKKYAQNIEKYSNSLQRTIIHLNVRVKKTIQKANIYKSIINKHT